jgi:antirestriction protein ArdC
MTERQNRALELLRENVERIRTSEEWEAALRVRSRLHRYSFQNAMLIRLQCPDATMVAGYRKWQELGRQVRKGERSIAILAPLVGKREVDGEERPVVFGFRAASVFDVSQTDGDPVPSFPAPAALEGHEEEADRLFALLSTYAASIGSPIEVTSDVGHPRALGSFRPDTREIKVRDDLSPLQRLKTGVHEVAHALLHANIGEHRDNDLRELEAESAAYLVSTAIGLDTGAYSFVYLAHYAGDADALLKSGDAAVRASDSILAGLGVQQGGATAPLPA